MLKARTDILKLRVEGHTDARGSADTNRRLSDDRAASVLDYLVRTGIDPARLTSVGLGEDQPVDDRNVAEAWEVNRRVEFIIVERSDETVTKEIEPREAVVEVKTTDHKPPLWPGFGILDGRRRTSGSNAAAGGRAPRPPAASGRRPRGALSARLLAAGCEGGGDAGCGEPPTVPQMVARHRLAVEAVAVALLEGGRPRPSRGAGARSIGVEVPPMAAARARPGFAELLARSPTAPAPRPMRWPRRPGRLPMPWGRMAARSGRPRRRPSSPLAKPPSP